MMMRIMLSNLPYLLYQESYCIETIVYLDVVLYSQSVLLSHWRVTIQCVCYLTYSTFRCRIVFTICIVITLESDNPMCSVLLFNL